MDKIWFSDAYGNKLDTIEYLHTNGTFVFASFTLPSPVNEHCMEPLSKTEALLYGGQDTRDVYIIDFVNDGQVTPKQPLILAGQIFLRASCGSYVDNGDKYVIYAGGEDSRYAVWQNCLNS